MLVYGGLCAVTVNAVPLEQNKEKEGEKDSSCKFTRRCNYCIVYITCSSVHAELFSCCKACWPFSAAEKLVCSPRL